MNVIAEHETQTLAALILDKDPVEAMFFASCMKSLDYPKTMCVIFTSLDDAPPMLVGGIVDVALVKSGIDNEEQTVTILLECGVGVVVVVRDNGAKLLLSYSRNDRLFYMRKDELNQETLKGIIWAVLEEPSCPWPDAVPPKLQERPMRRRTYLVPPEPARKAAFIEENERRYGDLVNSIAEYVYSVVYTDGKISSIYHSPMCEEITGYTQDEYYANPDLWSRMIHPDDRERTLAFFRDESALLQKREIEHRIVHKDGSIRWALNHSRLKLDKSGKAARLDGMILDITARKDAETKLLEKQEELIRAKEKAENATKLKDKFISLVAHDIRSPFSSMLGLLNLLQNGDPGSLNEQQKDIISRSVKSGEQLILMVDDLLNLNRFQTGRITIMPRFLDASAVGAYAVGRLEQLARQKEIALINGVPAHRRIFADPDLFNEVILNFVTNAIKFSPPGGRIEILIPEGRPTTISVKDTGVGVPPGILPNLFNCEVPTSTRGTAGERGTGLGLPLAHEIMQAHGGSIDVETVVGAGSVFHANLPYVRPVVLIVEDDDNERLVYKTQMGKLDAQILEAKNGEEGLQMALSQPVHLVLSDIHMPVMDGYEMLAKLKNNLKTSQIPVIVMTSSSSIESREKVLRLGADDFVVKPIMENELIPRVRRFIC